jgi:hypothetical protein
MESVMESGVMEGGDSQPDQDREVESPVNFDEAALVELEVEGVDYRIDAGRAGTALCISQRESGTWDWSFIGEARYAAKVLRCKGLDRGVLDPLSRALNSSLEEME